LPLLGFDDREHPTATDFDLTPMLSKRTQSMKSNFDDGLHVNSSPRVLSAETGGPFVDDKVREILERARKVKRHESVKSNNKRKDKGSMENTPLLEKANKDISEETFVLPDLAPMDDSMTRDIMSSPSLSGAPFYSARQKAYETARSNGRKYPNYKYISAPEYGLPPRGDSASATLIKDNEEASTEIADVLLGESFKKRPSPNSERLAYLKQRTQSFDSLLNNGSTNSKLPGSQDRLFSQSMEDMEANYQRLMEDHQRGMNRPLDQNEDVL
jgi:hypothetical protein